MIELETITKVLQALLLVAVYFIFSFGPGFIIGVRLANRLSNGKNMPLRIDQHRELIKKASAHNAQWHPDHERWK